jgi:hypothetical protein
VTCEIVQRLSTRGSARVTSPPPPRIPASNGIKKNSLESTTPVAKAPKATAAVISLLPPENSDAAPKDVSGGEELTESAIPLKSPQIESKESPETGHTGKRKTPAVTSGNGSGGSLASMWGRGPPKPKAPSPPEAVAAENAKNASSKASAKTSAKPGSKPGKGQGNITSFFKKS